MKSILRYKNTDGSVSTPVTKITAGEGIEISRLKDASGLYELDEVVINGSSLEVDEDIYALLQALNDEVL